MDDWDTVTKIGSKTRGPGSGPRETVVRGKAALNAAQRSGGIVATEKKFATGNSAATKASSQDGQRMTKLDRADGPVKPTYVGDLGKTIAAARSQLPAPNDQKTMAQRWGVGLNDLKAIENGSMLMSSAMKDIKKIERNLKIKLTGSNIGEPLVHPSKKNTPAPPKK